jgi:hypothetical protein
VCDLLSDYAASSDDHGGTRNGGQK